jgi:hypothetical protein
MITERGDEEIYEEGKRKNINMFVMSNLLL